MIHAGKARTWIFALGLVAACSQSSSPVPESGPLPDGIAARVADDDIPSALVAEVALRQNVSRREARDRLIGDALFAAEARSRFKGTGYVETAERSALARAVLDAMKAEARAAGAPTDAEVDALVKERWYEFDRPPLVRTTHAVVVVKNPADEGKARRVAERIREAVTGATKVEDFSMRARRVAGDGLEVRVENLDPVASDGRTLPGRPGAPNVTLDPAYSSAAHALGAVGDQSPIVKSAFGFHLILLTEKIDELRYTRDQSRRMLEHEIFDRRAARMHAALLEQASKSTRITRERALDDLLMRVKVADGPK
jgi:hypothetical protein